MADTPPMSAEDRARHVLIREILRLQGWSLGSDHQAKEILKALSSEGLAVVAQEDVPTCAELRAIAKGDKCLGRMETGLRDDGLAKLRRLSGADQDG